MTFGKTRIAALAFFTAFALAGQHTAFGQTITPRADYSQFITQKQTVDLLIKQAWQAFKNPTRISGAGFTGKMPSNMEIVAQKLSEAHQLEPWRADLLFSIASAWVYNNDTQKAIDTYKQILADSPEDVDALIYTSAWLRFAGQRNESEACADRLKKISLAKAEELRRFYAVIDKIAGTAVTEKLSAGQLFQLQSTHGNNAIVTLGYALNPDGTMHDILIQRLKKTLEVARQLSDAPIIVTGGVPQNGKTEGQLMASWLIENGIKPERIIQDNYARSTVENALYSRYVLSKLRIKNAVIISSGSHVRRAQAIFEIASWESGPHDIQFMSVSAPDKPLSQLQPMTKKELQGIYRDSLKASGLWSFRSYPLEER